MSFIKNNLSPIITYFFFCFFIFVDVPFLVWLSDSFECIRKHRIEANLWLRYNNRLCTNDLYIWTVTGGRLDAVESLSSVECYNPISNSWHEVAPLSTPKRCIAVSTLNGRIYAVGGSGGWQNINILFFIFTFFILKTGVNTSKIYLKLIYLCLII